MLKRFSTSYMAMLLLLDSLLLQGALFFASHFPWVDAGAPSNSPTMAPSALWDVHLVGGLLWLVAFFMLAVYTPREVVRWYDEFRRVLLAHITAALCLAGLFYLTDRALPRPTYFLFVLTGFALLLGYRILFRLWYRLQQEQ